MLCGFVRKKAFVALQDELAEAHLSNDRDKLHHTCLAAAAISLRAAAEAELIVNRAEQALSGTARMAAVVVANEAIAAAFFATTAASTVLADRQRFCAVRTFEAHCRSSVNAALVAYHAAEGARQAQNAASSCVERMLDFTDTAKYWKDHAKQRSSLSNASNDRPHKHLRAMTASFRPNQKQKSVLAKNNKNHWTEIRAISAWQHSDDSDRDTRQTRTSKGGSASGLRRHTASGDLLNSCVGRGKRTYKSGRHKKHRKRREGLLRLGFAVSEISQLLAETPEKDMPAELRREMADGVLILYTDCMTESRYPRSYWRKVVEMQLPPQLHSTAKWEQYLMSASQAVAEAAQRCSSSSQTHLHKMNVQRLKKAEHELKARKLQYELMQEEMLETMRGDIDDAVNRSDSEIRQAWTKSDPEAPTQHHIVTSKNLSVQTMLGKANGKRNDRRRPQELRC